MAWSVARGSRGRLGAVLFEHLGKVAAPVLGECGGEGLAGVAGSAPGKAFQLL